MIVLRVLGLIMAGVIFVTFLWAFFGIMLMAWEEMYEQISRFLKRGR